MMLIRKQTDGLDLLTESKLEKRFRAGERSLARLQAGYYMAELLRELTDEGDPQPALFDVAQQAHAAFHTGRDIGEIVTVLESQALVVCGHFPSLDQCCGCARRIEPQVSQHHFSPTAGGIVCQDCRVYHGNTLILSEIARSVWIRCTQPSPPEWRSDVAGELRGISLRWLNHLLGHRLKTQDGLSAKE
jgi:DNA repair protein RecO (recombination protein O)